MNKMDHARQIVAQFCKIEPHALSDDTLIDRRALAGSVLLHRMYAKLEQAGIHIANRGSVHTFGDLRRCLEEKTSADGKMPERESLAPELSARVISQGLSVGVDIEEVANLPAAQDFRTEIFYADNFSAKEISYCLLQPEPRVSFAGKFAAKEAIIKADPAYRSMPFHRLEILNDEAGRPYFRDWVLSISHTSQYALSVAIRPAIGDRGSFMSSGRRGLSYGLMMTAFVFSLLALIIALAG